MGNYLRIHWHVHALWAIGTLAAIICWLSLRTQDGGQIRDFIGFTSSVAALLLAVIAIVQGLISNINNNETSGAIRTSALDLQKTASNLAETSASISSQQEQLLGEVRRFPSEMSRLEDMINRVDKDNGAPAGRAIAGGDQLTEAAFGFITTLKLILDAHRANKAFDPYEVFKDEEVFSNWCAGALNSIEVFGPMGIKIVGIAAGRITLFEVKDLGDLAKPEIAKYVDEYPDSEYRKSIFKKIMLYFGARSTVEASEGSIEKESF